MIKFEGGVNEIQHIQRSMMEVAEEKTKEEVWSEVISWVEKGGKVTRERGDQM